MDTTRNGKQEKVLAALAERPTRHLTANDVAHRAGFVSGREVVGTLRSLEKSGAIHSHFNGFLTLTVYGFGGEYGEGC